MVQDTLEASDPKAVKPKNPDILEHRLIKDTLFKVYFDRNEDLLPSFVGSLLRLPPDSIREITHMNSEMPPAFPELKFCRFDSRLAVDGQRVIVEVQAEKKLYGPDRPLFYWAREYTSSLHRGENYPLLQPVVVATLTDFRFPPDAVAASPDAVEATPDAVEATPDADELNPFGTEHMVLNTQTHAPLSKHLVLLFFDLTKLPKEVNPNNLLGLWLALFRAKTHTDLKRIAASGVPIMVKAVEAYCDTVASKESQYLEYLREKARVIEAIAIENAKKEVSAKFAEESARKDDALARQAEENARKDDALARQAEEIARLKELLKNK